MDKSETIKELAVALCKAQNQMMGAAKDATNPFFKSKYADMGSVVQAVKQPFADNGLSYAQFPMFEDGKAGVETILMHDSGEYMSSVLMLPMANKQDPQSTGSAITYARRYALQSIAGIPSEDDDGQAATKATQTQQQDYSKPMATYAANKESIDAFKEAFKTEDFSHAVACWEEISIEERRLLWVAPTKLKAAGLPEILSTEERTWITNESSKYGESK